MNFWYFYLVFQPLSLFKAIFCTAGND